ncbi:hypothetical protein AB3M93_09910 [Novosphingobium panipatense]|uniref:hypothetical protein n=1 Tax=Novosphingobium panipatense TaxID=428991 RepID=UPI0039A05CA8
MGSQTMRGYTLDVSEYLFRLTTESLRIHSNQTRRYQSLANLVNARATASAAGAIEQHDVETLRQHLEKVPTKGPIRIYLSISKTSAENLTEAKRRLEKHLGSALTVGDAVSMLLFDYVVEQGTAKLMSRIGIDQPKPPKGSGGRGRDEGEKVVRIR